MVFFLVTFSLEHSLVLFARASYTLERKYIARRKQTENDRHSIKDCCHNTVKNIAADERRVAQELAEKEHLQELLASLRQRYSETTATLQQYYDLDIIFPKYRNMTAMCSIYEYYLSGRCDSLMGHEGAYNILECEIRFGVIFTKLDDIMSKLDEIKTNQSILYDAIESGNKLTNKLIDASIQQARQLEFVAEKTELAAYNAQRAANEANQIKWIKILELSERNN